MKCPKCGERLKKDFLYCEKCGEEIRIVPDFEPEIENSIIETLSAVAEEMSPSVETGMEEENEDEFVVESGHKWKRYVLIGISIICLLIIGSFLFFFGRNIYLDNYYAKQLKNAQLAYNQKDYVQAASFYKNVLKMEENNELLVSYADCLYAMGNVDQALSNYYAVIEKEPDNEMAYARIIAIYEKEKDYAEINRILMLADASIQAQFQDYLAVDPVFNYAGGTYNQVLPLKIHAPSTGTIYYSLDGSNPRYGGEKYSSPIFLRYGSYKVKAVFVNEFGFASNIVEAEYLIDGTQPKAPVVLPESGNFDSPQKIVIEVEPGSTVYYTTDGSEPDETSSIYGEPIPMKEGIMNYRFIAVNADGVYSDITARTYQLAVETNYTAEESVYRLKHRLVEKHIILDVEGNLNDMPGKNIYVYNSVQIVENKIFHIIYEYYQEGNNSRLMTGNIYGIDGGNGYVYKIIKDENGAETLDPI